MKRLTVFVIAFIVSTSGFSNTRTLIGTHLAEFSIFKIDVYQISYYRLGDGTEEMVLDYKTDVKKKYSVMGWEEGLNHVLEKNPEYKTQYDWITSKVVDLKKGDKFIIRKKDDHVVMIKNGTQIATIKDPIVASMVYEPWIGSKPVDKDLKRNLLKNQRNEQKTAKGPKQGSEPVRSN